MNRVHRRVARAGTTTTGEEARRGPEGRAGERELEARGGGRVGGRENGVSVASYESLFCFT